MTLRRLLMTSMLVTGFALSAGVAGAKDLSTADIEKIVHDYIMDHPEVLIKSVEQMQQKEQAKADEQSQEKLKDNADWLYKNKEHFEAGNPKGDATIVEFFDYNCGYCKQAVNDVLTILDRDKNVRLVFVEIPILGESSVEAARWAIAAGKQDQYLAYHSALMRHKGPLNQATLEENAKKLGLDIERMKKDAADPQTMVTINKNLDMARTFGINGTPAFVVGDNIIRGYVGLEGLEQSVTEVRKK